MNPFPFLSHPWRTVCRAAACTLAFGLIAGCPAKQKADAAADDDTASPLVHIGALTVATSQIAERIEAPGSVVQLPGRGAAVLATGGGRVLALDVRVGQTVRAGQPLARLQEDPTVHADAIKSQLTLTLARSESQRQGRLFKAGVTSRAQLEQANSAFATAQADADARRTADGLARSNARPVAPISGIVTQVGAIVGAVADPATPLVTIADLRKVGVQAEVLASQLGRIGAGMRGTAVGAGGERAPARVVDVDPAVDPQTQRGKFLAEVDNAPNRFKLAMFATVELELGHHSGIAIPAGAVVDRAGRQVVYVIKAGIAHERPVELGSPTGDGRTEIPKGLALGERVVTEGAYQLTEGAKVTTDKVQPSGDDAATGSAMTKSPAP